MSDASLRAYLSYDESCDHFFWKKDIVSLKNLIAELLNDDSIATATIKENKHHNMLSFKTQHGTVKLYQSTNRIITQGCGTSTIITALSNLLKEEEVDRSISTEPLNVPLQNSDDDEDHDVTDLSPTSSVLIESTCCSDDFRSGLQSATRDILQLKSDVQSLLKFRADYLNSGETDTNLNTLQNENKDLSDENKTLKNQIQELKGAVDTLQQEKSALLMSLRLLKEANQEKTTINQQVTKETDQRSCNTKVPQTKDNSKAKKKKTTKPNNDVHPEAKLQPQPQRKDPLNTTTSKKSVYVLGDSMLKGIQWWKLQRDSTKVFLRDFRGATTEDMNSYVLPAVRNEPEEIIIHVGTNDLQQKSARQVAEGIVNLCDNIEQNCNSKVTVSSIICRADEDLNKKVTEANKILRTFTANRKWAYIDNSRITRDYLNNSGLHLNEKGSTALAKNITRHLFNSH